RDYQERGKPEPREADDQQQPAEFCTSVAADGSDHPEYGSEGRHENDQDDDPVPDSERFHASPYASSAPFASNHSRASASVEKDLTSGGDLGSRKSSTTRSPRIPGDATTIATGRR